ncbi:MAG TPA: discoidin domain-containing protein [Opitutaceae bacterium]
MLSSLLSRPRLSVVVAGFMILPVALSAARIDGAWRILVGSDPLELTAGEDVARELKERDGLSLPVAVAGAADAGPAIVIGTPADNPLVAAEDNKAAFDLSGTDKERYHLVTRGDRLYAVGATPKGAMNAAFRFLDRQTRETAGIDEAKSPLFRYRVGGHKYNQSPPPWWSEEDQARFYARNYLNVVWGEKHGPPLSFEARKKYGLGLMAELRFPKSAGENWQQMGAASEAWFADPANSDSAYYSKEGSKRRVVSPFDTAGRKAYLDGYRTILKANPDIAILYSIFGDYVAIPGPESVRISDGKPYGHSREETMLEILKLMKEAIGDRDIAPRAWMWHGFYGQPVERAAFMRELQNHGFGPMYNEAGDDDCWLTKLDNFDGTALATGPDGRSLYGPNYLALASIGGACESGHPVIGTPLPRVAAYKLGRIAAAGVRDVVLWWASAEGWVYQPNIRAMAKLIWADNASSYGNSKDFASAEPLLQQIAEEDFGPELAPEVVAYWRKFDEAIVSDSPRYKKATEENYGDPATGGLRIYDWYQRLGVYTSWPFGAALLKPVTPEEMAATKYGGWGRNPYTLANYAAVIGHMAAAERDLEAIVAKASNPGAKHRLEDTLTWTTLYRLILIAQSHHVQARKIVDDLKDEPLDSPTLRSAFEPLVREAIANTKEIIALTRTLPENAELTMAHRDAVYNLCKRDAEIAKLEGKLMPMQIWLGRSENLARGKRVQASSEASGERVAELAVDGNPETLWASEVGETGWITVDLGRSQPLTSARLVWKTAFAKTYEVQVADKAAARHWKTVYKTESGKDGPVSIMFPEGTTGRFLRILCLKRGSPYGYALREIEIYGE